MLTLIERRGLALEKPEGDGAEEDEHADHDGKVPGDVVDIHIVVPEVVEARLVAVLGALLELVADEDVDGVLEAAQVLGPADKDGDLRGEESELAVVVVVRRLVVGVVAG